MQRRMDDLSGRVAVVIGGGSGIGRGIALGLAAEGMRVVVADIDAASAAGVRDEITAAGGTATATQVDGTDRQSLGRLAEDTVAEHGAVHVLSTNVGVVADRPLTTASETDWAWIIEFNLMSAVRAVDVFLPHLRASGSAHIVITASLAALLAPPASAASTSACTRPPSTPCSATPSRCVASSPGRASGFRCCAPAWCARTSPPPPPAIAPNATAGRCRRRRRANRGSR
jgi:NAD(P)-dependent dehydrogenase (short-subunit alcohol dehydrogenase family)